jgi:hypothetical protein
MALKVEGVVYGGMHTQEALGGSSRFEPLHLALASSHRLMGVFGPIVSPEPLFMRASQSQTPERSGVGAKLVGWVLANVPSPNRQRPLALGGENRSSCGPMRAIAQRIGILGGEQLVHHAQPRAARRPCRGT